MSDHPGRRPAKRRFHLEIEDAGGTSLPLDVRLRAWLKAGLRGWHLRCRRASEEAPAAEDLQDLDDDQRERGEPVASH
jgi:hypothetical protein